MRVTCTGTTWRSVGTVRTTSSVSVSITTIPGEAARRRTSLQGVATQARVPSRGDHGALAARHRHPAHRPAGLQVDDGDERGFLVRGVPAPAVRGVTNQCGPGAPVSMRPR
ncbi:hypothetical protein GCM10023108_49570 [Saccharopolyspora hordei]